MSCILLTGPIGIGKSTVIRRILSLAAPQKLAGFMTKKEPPEADGHSRVYIHPAGAAERSYTEGNRVGLCCGDRSQSYPRVFGSLGVALLTGVPDGSLVIMDELGVFEASSPEFCRAVMDILDGGLPVLGVLKKKNSDFLRAVAAHPRVRVVEVTRENRDELPALLAEEFKQKN